MAQHRTDRDRRRLPCEPGRRARNRPRLGDPEGGQDFDRPGADPARPRRGWPHRLRASRAAMDVRGPRRNPRRRHRGNQYSRRGGSAELEEGSRLGQSGGLEVRAVAAQRRRADQATGGYRHADRNVASLDRTRREGRSETGAVHRHWLPGPHRG